MIFNFGGRPGRPGLREVHFPGAAWETRTAAEAGMDQAAMDQLATDVGGQGFLARDGYQVHTWGSQTAKAEWASAAKPVTATMLLFAVQEGLLGSVNDLIADHGWSLIAKDEPMTFLHLTNMVSGYARDEAPGDAFAYNDFAVQLFATTLFDRVFSGASPNAIATDPNRLGKLQFEDGTLYSSRSGYGISTTPRDFARIGWLWANKGRWADEHILAPSVMNRFFQPLVHNAVPITEPFTTNDYLGVGSFGGQSDQADIGPGVYGFGFWWNGMLGTTGNRCFPNAPNDLYLAQGHFGDETMAVIPSLGLVCAADGSWGDLRSDAGVADSTMDARMALLASTVI